MKIDNKKVYRVYKYTRKNSYDLGRLPGIDVKATLGTAKYDEKSGMFFTAKATIGYEVIELED